MSFQLGPALPSGDKFAVALCRLMTATNDVILLQKLTIIARAQADALAGPDKMIVNNETGYFVRMLFGHLYEAGIAFRELDAKCSDRRHSQLPRRCRHRLEGRRKPARRPPRS